MILCQNLGIELLWNVGGGKAQSSSTLISNIKWGRQKLDVLNEVRE